MDAIKEESEQEVDMVKAAEAVALRIEAANKRTEELIEEQKKLQARAILSGKAEAGTKPTPKEEISDLEYSRLALQNKIPRKQ